jgi:hypothetical protein
VKEQKTAESKENTEYKSKAVRNQKSTEVKVQKR